MTLSEDPRHPMQPVVVADDGIHRFKVNPLVEYLLRTHPTENLNTLSMFVANMTRRRAAQLGFRGAPSDDDYGQLMQLIGYSVSGASGIESISDEVFQNAMAESQALMTDRDDEQPRKGMK